MKSIKPFGGSKDYALVAGTLSKQTDLIPIEEAGHLSFCASIDTAGVTVTPTLKYYYGQTAGAAQTLKNTDNSDATTFTSSAPFECSINKQSHMKSAIGAVVIFTFDTIVAGTVLTCEFVTSEKVRS